MTLSVAFLKDQSNSMRKTIQPRTFIPTPGLFTNFVLPIIFLYSLVISKSFVQALTSIYLGSTVISSLPSHVSVFVSSRNAPPLPLLDGEERCVTKNGCVIDYRHQFSSASSFVSVSSSLFSL